MQVLPSGVENALRLQPPKEILRRVAEGFTRTFYGTDQQTSSSVLITPAAGRTWLHEACRDARTDPRITKRTYRMYVRPFAQQLLSSHGCNDVTLAAQCNHRPVGARISL